MKTVSTECPTPKPPRRVPKPQMEKRRRDRINHSLETLRLLLLENTSNEKLKNPKVEKAEILESVVHFFKRRVDKEEPCPVKTPSRGDFQGERLRSPYSDGMRSCLLRVSHFIASKNQELEEDGRGAGSLLGAFGLDRVHHGRLHKALASSTCDPTSPSGRPVLRPGDPGLSTSSERTCLGYDHDPKNPLSPKKLNMDIIDPVWRPWPQ